MPKVQEKIEALIAARGLAPGARLPAERVLAAELGVSRAKLREAIQALASRGRLSSLRGSGTFVATGAPPLSGALAPLASLAAHEPGYWQDVMEIRKSLDADMAFYAALRATPADRDHLARALAALDAAEGAPDARAAAAALRVVGEACLRRSEEAAARERRSALPFPPSHEQNPRGTVRADAAGMKG